MSSNLGGVGRVIVDGVSYANSWVEPGKTIRQVICAKCLDTGREMTDDGSRGEICDCRTGEAARDAELALYRYGREWDAS